MALLLITYPLLLVLELPELPEPLPEEVPEPLEEPLLALEPELPDEFEALPLLDELEALDELVFCELLEAFEFALLFCAFSFVLAGASLVIEENGVSFKKSSGGFTIAKIIKIIKMVITTAATHRAAISPFDFFGFSAGGAGAA